MNPRIRRRQPGQSLPLLALLMVVLIAMTGLSVDVGHAFSQERQLQGSANAAALAGINTVVAGNESGQLVTNQRVWNNVQSTLAGNSVDPSGIAFTFRADYILSNGSRVLLGIYNGDGSAPYVENAGGSPPDNIIRLQITSTQTIPTFFVRAVGRDDFTVNVNGNACLGGYGLGVLSMGVPLNLKKNVFSGGSYVPYHRIYKADGSLLPTSDTSWGNWTTMVGRSIVLPIASSDDLDGSHVAWLSWKGATDNTTLAAAMTYPSTLQDGFVEGPVADTSFPNTRPVNRLSLGDWVAGKTGLPSTIAGQLTTLKTSKQEIGLPIYDMAGKVSGKSTFRTVKIGLFRVVDSTLTSGGSSIGSNFVKLEYLGDKTAAPTECAGEPLTPPPPGKEFNINGVAKLDAIWATTRQTSSTTYDFVLVMDTSGSMARDWHDREPYESGWTGARIVEAKRVIKDFVRSYDVAADPDARMAFVTFSGDNKPAKDLARVVTDWSKSGCPADTVITPTLCTADMKWKPVQSASNSMNPEGYTPGPVAFEAVETLLKNKRTPPAGKAYEQVVIFATDGVFNVCGSVPPVNPPIALKTCNFGQVANKDKENDAGYMLVPGRPIWQAQQVAARIKKTSVPIFVVALTPKCTPSPTNECFSTKGLSEMSSGTGYYFEADDPNALAGIYKKIISTIIETECQPASDQVFAPGTVIRLSQPSNPSIKATTVADGSGKWSFKGLEAGEYIIKADPVTYVGQDGKARTYSELVNMLNPNEEKQASVFINSQSPNGSYTPAQIKLTLPRGEDGSYPNGCQGR